MFPVWTSIPSEDRGVNVVTTAWLAPNLNTVFDGVAAPEQ
uniref:Uncharacterized protein n=1 Tax=Peronospora matthiolae TaxID=2874970 RepID=A0AAV1UKE5_9STRA